MCSPRLLSALNWIDVALVSQPKLAPTVCTENRHAPVRSYSIWDPFLHQVKPVLFDACQSLGFYMHLYTNGHLICNACVLYCGDCKREFCILGKDDFGLSREQWAAVRAQLNSVPRVRSGNLPRARRPVLLTRSSRREGRASIVHDPSWKIAHRSMTAPSDGAQRLGVGRS